MRDGRENDSIDGMLERAKDRALGAHHPHPTLADELGEATGGISGVLIGAGIGSAAGPIGALIGGIAGALGGWWTGRAVAEAASSLSEDDEAYFREHYEQHPDRLADRDYSQVRGAYYLGQIASHNPNFRARQFEDIEPQLEQGWTSQGDQHGDWETVRPFAREGYSRGQSKLDDAGREGYSRGQSNLDDAARKGREKRDDEAADHRG